VSDSPPNSWSYDPALMDAGTGSIVHEFNRLVIRYFALFTNRSTERMAWLRQAEIAIAELYGAGLRLPNTEPSDRDAPQMQIENQRRLMTEIVDRIGGDSIPYSFVFHPLEPNAKPVVGSLADDLASIYQDLYEGSALLAAGGTVEDVIWTWKINFEIHWGRHALGALQALNDMLR
jgi:uncharacterized protein DUF5063